MDQEALFAPPVPPRRESGRHENMVRAAIKKAELDGTLKETDGAGISLAIANGWALDEAENAGQPYAVAQITGPFMELLQELGLITKEANSDDDQLSKQLADLAGND